jgi:putative tricarboxylic transport membrane protein
VLALVLGPMIESNLRRAMNQFNGDWTRFFTDPVALLFIVIAVLWVSVPQILKLRGKKVLVEEG